MTALGDVTLVWVDSVGSDWVAIYLNGDKVYEGHPPELNEGLTKLGIAHEDRTVPSASLRDLRRMRGLPDRLEKVAAP